jgi:quercetin dioxygenase-like cupin family protein
LEEDVIARRTILAALALGLAVAVSPSFVLAQAPPPATQGSQGVKRTILQKMDVPGTNLETIVAVVEIAANFKAGRHTHPGDVTGYVTQGEFFMAFDGQPQKVLKPGESILVPNGTVHDEGTGEKPAKLIAVYVVEKGKPIASPVK